jgi:hypothetical protein
MAVAAVTQIQAKKRLEAARKLQEHDQQIAAVILFVNLASSLIVSLCPLSIDVF